MLQKGCIYRPPKASKQVADAINESLRSAWRHLENNQVNRVLVCGDFNYPNISWPTKGLQPTTTNSSMTSVEAEFKKLVQQLNAVQNIGEKTFQRDLGERTNTLDLVLTEKSRRCRNLRYDQPLGETRQGHLQISWDYKFKNRGFIHRLFFCVSA